MTTCFDTSALVKLFVPEAGSTAVETIWIEADDPVVSIVGYAELHASLARAHGAGRLHADRHVAVREAVATAWRRTVRVYLDDPLAARAGRLAERHALGALDAIHLASALSLREPGEEVALVTFDRRMRDAALAEGLTVLPEAL